MEPSSTCPSFYLAESSHHHRHWPDVARTLTPEGLHQPHSAAGRLPDVGHHPEVMADRRGAISTRTDRDPYRDHDHQDNIEVHTGVAQDPIRPDQDHQGDAELVDGTALAGMARDGGVLAIAAIVAMTIEAGAGVG